MNYLDISQVYHGSNGDATKALYARLEKLGVVGLVAMNIFRACKTSQRAKVYRGGGYRGMAYDKKQWSIDNLCKIMAQHGDTIGVSWGWGIDEAMRDRAGDPHWHVIYIDLPTGQVSFHNGARLDGPTYPKKWDSVRNQAPDRICRWCAELLKEKKSEAA